MLLRRAVSGIGVGGPSALLPDAFVFVGVVLCELGLTSNRRSLAQAVDLVSPRLPAFPTSSQLSSNPSPRSRTADPGARKDSVNGNPAQKNNPD